MFSVLVQLFLLTAALSVDIFAVGFTYGAGRIRLSSAARFCMTGLPALVLTLSMGLGGAVENYFPEKVSRILGAALLAGLGLWNLWERPPREAVTKADKNQDQVISSPEALALSAALSLDSLAGGIGAGTGKAVYLAAAFAFGLLTGLAALLLGEQCGARLCKSMRFRPGLLGGGILILLAFWRMNG